MKLSEEKARRHFTTSAYIVDEDRILLVHHKKSGLWLPVGGHIEENETPIQALEREIKEESGLDIEIVKLSDYRSSYPIAEILPSPWKISLHSAGDHQHMDLNYIAVIKGINDSNGTEECKWFTADETQKLDNCPEEVKDSVNEAIRIVKSIRQ